MLKRTITAVLALCLFLPILYFSDTLVFPAAMTFLSVIAADEMLRCVGAKHRLALSIPSYLLAFLPLVPALCAEGEGADPLAVSGAALCLYLVFLLTVAVFAKGSIPFSQVAAVFTTVFYVAVTFASIVALRQRPNGKYLYLLVFIGPWVSDTFAYFTGRLFGKHKLIPEISPAKTVEGSVGGIVAAAVCFVIYGAVIHRFFPVSTEPRFLLLAILGALVSVISQIGDLAASFVKRNYGIKDYGTLFPGHGGVLDRFDSVLLTAPIFLIVSSFPLFDSLLL